MNEIITTEDTSSTTKDLVIAVAVGVTAILAVRAVVRWGMSRMRPSPTPSIAAASLNEAVDRHVAKGDIDPYGDASDLIQTRVEMLDQLPEEVARHEDFSWVLREIPRLFD